MDIYSLPSDLRLNIIEYAGDARLRLHDVEIIKRIKVYDPSFDHHRWKKNVRLWRAYVEKMENHPLLPIYNIVKANNLIIATNENILYIYGKNTYLDKSIDIIIKAIKSAGYAIASNTRKNAECTDEYDTEKIRVVGASRLYHELVDIWVYKYDNNGRTESYSESMRQIKKNSYIPLIDLEIFNIPTTLNEYLRYAIMRKRGEEVIKKHRDYRLYTLLEPFPWYIHPPYKDEIFYELGLYGKVSSETMDLIEDELVDLLGRDNVERDDGARLFNINRSYMPKILDIDTFYYPHIIPGEYFDELE